MHDRYDRQFPFLVQPRGDFTDLIRNELKSYKQLPVTLSYQIQDKFQTNAVHALVLSAYRSSL